MWPLGETCIAPRGATCTYPPWIMPKDAEESTKLAAARQEDRDGQSILALQGDANALGNGVGHQGEAVKCDSHCAQSHTPSAKRAVDPQFGCRNTR